MKLLLGALVLAYPFLVFAGLQRFEPRTVALVLGGLVALRVLARVRRPTRSVMRTLLLPVLGVGAVLLGAGLTNDLRVLLFVPVAINLVLLVGFGRTLLGGPSLVETLARLEGADLDAAQVAHCRRVTQLWCGFFALSAALSGGLALAGAVRAWTLYTGLVAYLLMGLLFAGEVLVRAWRFRRYPESWAAPVLRRLFPPRATGATEGERASSTAAGVGGGGH